MYHFEAFTIGIQPYLHRIDTEDAALVERLRVTFESIKLDEEFIQITTGGGKNSPGPLNQRIGFIERRLEAAL